MVLTKRPCRIPEVLSDVVSRMRTLAAQRPVNLAAAVPAELPAVRTDPVALSQVLANLLENAIKYSHPDGQVEVSAGVTPAGLEIRVKDYGPGIPAEDLSRIFERFYRVDKARSRAVGGTGLGLSIVKHLVQLLDGQVAVDSQLQRGINLSRHPAAFLRRIPAVFFFFLAAGSFPRPSSIACLLNLGSLELDVGHPE